MHRALLYYLAQTLAADRYQQAQRATPAQAPSWVRTTAGRTRTAMRDARAMIFPKAARKLAVPAACPVG